MKSTYDLIWSEEALEGLKEILLYIENKFSAKDVQNFARKLDKQLSLIQSNPESFPLSPDSKKIRRAIVTRLTSIYYIIENDKIFLISVFDNRRNPDSRKSK